MFTIQGKYSNALVTIDDIDQECIGQITKFVNHQAFTENSVIMPDCHAGKGAVVGFTMPLGHKIVPNVVGVDIACGMISINLKETKRLDFAEIDQKIRETIPFGQNICAHATNLKKESFLWHEIYQQAKRFAQNYNEKFGFSISAFMPQYDYQWFLSLCKRVGIDPVYAEQSLGSVGGGNHFIELGLSQASGHWLTIHTGSRNLGLKIAAYWQDIASKTIDEHAAVRFNKAKERAIASAKTPEQKRNLNATIKQLKANFGIGAVAGKDELAYLQGEKAVRYMFDVIFAQAYANLNRHIIANKALMAIGAEPGETIISQHNFIDPDDFIIRKGAIRAYEGQKMIIPFNMRDGILICEGKSNPKWNFSAPHGAGRVLSRARAKNQLSLEKFEQQMHGIYSSSIGQATLDESPDAYKSAAMIEEAITPTAKIIDRIKPLMNIKDFVKRPELEIEQVYASLKI